MKKKDVPQGLGAEEADVRDASYQFAIPEIGSWFCIDERFLAGEPGMMRAWCDQARDCILVSKSMRLYLGYDAMCVGWSWALHFC